MPQKVTHPALCANSTSQSISPSAQDPKHHPPAGGSRGTSREGHLPAVTSLIKANRNPPPVGRTSSPSQTAPPPTTAQAPTSPQQRATQPRPQNDTERIPVPKGRQALATGASPWSGFVPMHTADVRISPNPIRPSSSKPKYRRLPRLPSNVKSAKKLDGI